MRKKVTAFTGSLALSIALLTASGGAHAEDIQSLKSQKHWQCVTFARALSGMQIFGDAWTWWDKASGKYATGKQPEPGAVLVFRSQGRMSRGHVAVVSRIITERVITITHANWSPIGGRRGQVEEDVTVVDVSENRDWSRVKVWYDPSKTIGTTAYSTYGFIYNSTDAAPGLPGKSPERPVYAANDAPAPSLLVASLTANAALNDQRPASMKTSVMVRFPARPVETAAATSAATNSKKPVSIEAVLAKRDDADTVKASKKTAASESREADTDTATAHNPAVKDAKPQVKAAALAEKLTGKAVKASKPETVKKAAQKTKAKAPAKSSKKAEPKAAVKTSAKVNTKATKAAATPLKAKAETRIASTAKPKAHKA